MPLDSEEIRCAFQCRILERRVTAKELTLLIKVERDPANLSATKYLKHADGEALIAMWRRITNNGTDEAEAKRGD